jgi:hypothetical protein
VTRPVEVQGQRASALPFADPHVLALFQALLLFCLLPRGFANKDLRERLACLLGGPPNSMTAGRMTYDLRRLRLHGLIERIPHSHRYRVTRFGQRTAMFYARTYSRIFRPGLARIDSSAADEALRPYFDKLEAAIDHWVARAKIPA